MDKTRLLFFPFILYFFIMMTSFLFYSAPAQAQEPIKGLSKEPIQLQADHLEFFQETQTYVATGHIKMIQETKEMSGDVVNFNQGTGQMEISGHVIISEGANQIKADKVVLNVKSQTGIIYQGHMIFGPDHYHLDGEIIEKVDRNEYFARNAMVTTCECIQYQDPSPPLPWRITTSELKVSPDHYLTGKNVFFEIRNIPVFYSPFLYLPIIKERQSGLLIPKLDYNSQDGFKILQPFYWVIAKNQDATFSVDYRSLRGLGAEIEYRYVVNSSSSGSLFTHFFKDTLVGLERSEVRYGHSQTLSEHVNARISLNYVSDQDFFKDLSVSTIDRSQRSLESNVYVSGIWENQTAYLLTRFTRDLTTDSDLTLQKLPEVGYSFHTAPIFSFPLYLDFNSTATYFYRQTGLKAGRSDTYVRLIDEIPLPHFGILTPRAGLRKTIYTRSISEDHKFERNISDLGVGLDSSVSRVYGGSEALTHVIESSLLYEYVPPVDQSDLPQFDNLDFIPDKNLFTYSLTNRLLKKEEVFYLKLTDSYLVNPTEGRFSDLRSEMMIRSGEFKVKTDGYFNFYSGSTDIFNADILIDSPGLGFFSVGERFSRQGSIPKKGDIFNPLSLGLLQDQPFPIRFLTSTVRIFLPYRWTFAAQYYFDYQNNIVAEADYGIRYIANCWGFSVGYVRFPEKSQVTFLINLTGLAEQGSDNLKSLFGN